MERNNVQALEQAIIEIAQQEVQTILNDAKIKAESLHKQAEAEAQAENKKIVQTAEEAVDKLIGQAIAKAQLEAQMLKLQRREQLLEDTFTRVREQLATVTDREDYESIIRVLAREAATYLGDQALTVEADARTKAILTTEFLDNLSQELGVTLELGPTLKNGTGIALTTASGHRRYDNTMETRLTRMQDSLRSTVYHILAQDSAISENAQ